jgi:hypothetical protein
MNVYVGGGSKGEDKRPSWMIQEIEERTYVGLLAERGMQ